MRLRSSFALEGDRHPSFPGLHHRDTELRSSVAPEGDRHVDRQPALVVSVPQAHW